MHISYKSSFVRQYDKLPPELQEEAKEKIALFQNANDRRQLKVHKLKGKLADCYSFSVNYRYRIVFIYESKTRAVLLAVGDHEVYR